MNNRVSDEMQTWYAGLYSNLMMRPGEDANIVNFVIPGTNLEYRLDKADKAITPLFADPGEYKAIHLNFRELVNQLYNETRATRVYLCESEWDNRYEKEAVA